MSLQYYLVPNLLTADPNDHMAITLPGKSFSIEDVYDQMTHEGSTVTKAEALANFEEIVRGIVRLVKDGNSIVTPLINISPRVSGVFTDSEDSFDSARHQVRLRINMGMRLKEAQENIRVEKVAPRERLPVPLHFTDNTTEQVDEVVTPGGGARLRGSLLKFDEADPSQGVFFINTSSNTETRVTTKMLKNKPAELIFVIPSSANLSAGTYRLEVRSVINNSPGIRKGILADELTVL